MISKCFDILLVIITGFSLFPGQYFSENKIKYRKFVTNKIQWVYKVWRIDINEWIFWCCIKRKLCLDLFFGIDYHSHLGTRRGGMAVHGNNGFQKIHS